MTPRNDGGFEVSVVSQTGPAKRTSRAGFAGGVSKAEAIKQATAAHGGFTSEKEAPAEPKPEVDTAVEDATQDELAPQPVQKVTDMPGVQQQAKAKAGEAVSKARVRAEQLAAEENPETVDAQAQAANPAPTDAQKSAGNYAKGHLSIGGLNISVETPAGATRTGRDGAKPWKVKNTAHYGYVKRTNGADGEQVDVYVKPGTAATHDGQVFVVDQYHPGTGAFDEHKAMIGYGNAAEAAKAYDAHFSDQSGAKRRGAVTAMPLGGFKTWLKNGDTMRPVSSRKFDGQASDPAQEAQDEIAQSTGARFSRQRKGEPDTDYLQRQVKEAEAALAASKKGRRKGESRDDYLQRRVEEARAKLSAASVTPPLPRTRREGESDTDYLRRRADEANAAKDARQTPPAKAFPTKARDEAAVREALGLENDAGVSILSPESRPDAGQARGVSKQAAQFIVQAARLFGKRVVFFDVPDPNAAEGIYAQDNTIYLNVNSSTQHLRVLGHELTHAMKNQAGEAYEKMLGAVAALRTDAEMVAQYKDYFNEDLDNPARLDQPHPGTQGTLREFLAEEWMADLGGNRFAESDFWTAVFAQLETQHGAPAAQGIIARLRAALVTALNKLKGLIGGNAFAVDARLAEHLEDIRVAVAQGFAEYARRSKAGALSGGSGQGTKFSPQKETTQTAFVEAVPSERTRAGRAAGALSGAQKSAFTQYVFGKVDPAKVARGVLGRIDVRVEVLASTGGYQTDGAESGKISPNVLVQVTPIGKRAVTLEEAVRVAQALNYVYTQDGVPVSRYDDQLLDMPADTPNVTHIVRFTLPGLQEGHAVSAQEETFYRQLEKAYGVGIGYSKINGKIVVGNYAGLAPEEFHRIAAEVAQAAGIKFEGTAAEGDYVFHDWENDGQGVDHEVWGNGDTAGRPNLQARLHGWRDGAVQTAAGWLDERGIKYSPGRRADIGGRYVGPESGRADSGSGGSVSGQSARRQDGQVSVTGVHFSKEPRSHLSGVYFDKGTGTKSQEAERVRQATDVRIKSRIYAYVNEGKGVFPEENVGRHAHKVAFDNLYDAAADPLDLWVKYRDANTRESAMLDRGFDGYYARGAFGNQGVAILMGKAATRGIAPDYRGTEYRGKELEVPPVGEPSEFGKQQQAITANRGLPDGEMTGADRKRLMPRLMPDIDVSHLDDAKKYYKNEIAQRPAKLSPARLAMQWESQTTNEVGPVYRGKGFGLRAVRKFDTETDFLEQDALPWGHAAFVRDPAYRFAVVDQTGAPVGFLDAEVNGLDEINAIHDMAIERPGEGLGAKVVETIMASTYDGVRVIDVLPQSERFWDRLGAGNYDLYKNTTLDFEGSPAEARFRHARSAGIRGAATAGTGENRRREARFSSARGAPTVTGVGYTTDHVESEGLPLFSLRRALNGEHNTDDHLVPETPLYLDNPNLVDLAYANGKPIRLNVGLDLGSGRGRGALHLIGSAAREGNRSLDQITDDEGENVVQTVIRVLGSGSAMLHWQEGKRYALRVPMANKTLIMQNDRNHYSIVTMLPSAANKWGTAEWTGRLTFPAPTAATTADPLAPAPAESSQAGLKGIGYSSEKFHTKPPVPAAQAPIVVRVAQKRHRTLDLAAMAADGLAVKKSPPRSTLGDLTPEQEAAATRVLGAPKTRMQRLAEFKKDWAQNLKQGIFDQFAPIAELDPNAYILARLSKGGESSLEALMLYGKLFVGADGATDVHYTKAGKPQGFASKMSELKGEHDRFFLWVAAQRADRLKAIGLENLFSDTDIADLKTLNQGAMKDGTGRPRVYAKALQDLNDFNDNVLEVAVASGLIDDQTRQMYRNTPYIPFYRLQEDDEVSGFGIKPGLVNQYAWKKLKGGTEQLNQDLMANLLHNWSHLITASARNRAAKATLDAAEKAGIAQQVASSLGQYVANKTTMLPPGTKGQVSYKEGSVEKSFVISDPHLMDAVAALHYAGLGPWAKPLSTAKHWLTVGVTANPAFKLRNLIRDTIGALGTAQLSYRADQNLVQGWRATAEDSETRAHLLASGGMIRFGSMLDGKDSQRAQDLIKAGVDPNMILDSDAKIRRFWKRFVSPALTAYNELGDRTEQVNRAALYEQLIAKGLTHAEAAYWARDLMDFSMSGKWTAIRTLTQTVPFFNARLQGLYKLGRAGKQDIRRLGTVLGAVTLASLALLLAYQDDDDWKKRWDSDRNNYWWFKVGGHAFRLPKPFEIGAVGTLAERSYEVAFNPEMTGDRFGKNLRDIVMSQLSMNPVPQLFKPMMDLYANRDSFTGQAIESMGMERLRKQDRFDERTSETAKFLGSLGLPDLTQFVMGRWDTLSPRQIDFLAKGYFSWLATMATTVLDYGIRPMINAGDRPDPQLKDVFFVGNFVESLPSNSSRYLTQMYDQAREIEQAYASYHARLKVGDVEGAKKILVDDGDLIRRQKATETLKRTESLMNVQLQRINASTTLTGEEKRIRLDQVYARRNAIAEQFRAL
ncbi:LPD38 domain-containing protein [Candidatus Accumulibacter vicinus]|uniref:LPD38 domain-containing protein n=1 Tax=Candidatus Accumulibacter vicinus TaxID=2954382 RepID=UPI00235B6DAB|nr:LPD38 domain-containing protein [Candidatus Accumulibacter vicinus]